MGNRQRTLLIFIARLCMIYYFFRKLCMIYYCSILLICLLQMNLPVARTDIQRGEKTESSSKLKLSTWWPIHAHVNTYAHLGSGALQSAQMWFSLLCNNSFSFDMLAGRQRWMWDHKATPESGVRLLQPQFDNISTSESNLVAVPYM